MVLRWWRDNQDLVSLSAPFFPNYPPPALPQNFSQDNLKLYVCTIQPFFHATGVVITGLKWQREESQGSPSAPFFENLLTIHSSRFRLSQRKVVPVTVQDYAKICKFEYLMAPSSYQFISGYERTCQKYSSIQPHDGEKQIHSFSVCIHMNFAIFPTRCGLLLPHRSIATFTPGVQYQISF